MALMETYDDILQWAFAEYNKHFISCSQFTMLVHCLRIHHHLVFLYHKYEYISYWFIHINKFIWYWFTNTSNHLLLICRCYSSFAIGLQILLTSDGPNSYFQYSRIRISKRIFYFNICECECKCEYYALIFANANIFIFMFITLCDIKVKYYTAYYAVCSAYCIVAKLARVHTLHTMHCMQCTLASKQLSGREFNRHKHRFAQLTQYLQVLVCCTESYAVIALWNMDMDLWSL